jgi:23S rRNA pseudouridine1911/1915/1917 synthase
VRSLKAFEDGILLNGVHARTIDRVRAGDVVTITLRDAPKDNAVVRCHCANPLRGWDLIVYNKPPAMACTLKTAPAGHACQCVRAGTAPTGRFTDLRIINRMDRDTSRGTDCQKHVRRVRPDGTCGKAVSRGGAGMP